MYKKHDIIWLEEIESTNRYAREHICNLDNFSVVAIADNVEDKMIEKCKRKVARTQGKENAYWVILDYGDIVVHVFQTPYRSFYRLEDLWADAERTVYED